MMKSLSLAFLLALTAIPAHAQQARVVAACGSLAPFGPDAVGGVAFPTMDTTGKLCLSGSGGGYTLPTASTTGLAASISMGTTVTIASGVISAAGGGGTITARTTCDERVHRWAGDV